MNANNLPMVDPMMIRKFTLHADTHAMFFVGGVLVMDAFNVEDVGLAESRLSYDEPIVDCSNRIFQLTTQMMMASPEVKLDLCAFPSRRWRNFRDGEDIIGMPSYDEPLLYLGNPVRVFCDRGEGILVVRLPEFLIKSGMELGY